MKTDLTSAMKSPAASTMLLLLAAALSTTAFAAAGKAEPAATPTAQTQMRPAATQVQMPGQISGLSANHATVSAGDPIVFTVQGSGHCKLTLNFGDGHAVDQEGELPLTVGPAQYSTATMLSYETFKTYTAQATPQGACKIAQGKSASVAITVNNPDVQGVPGGSKPAPVILPTGASLPCVKGAQPGSTAGNCK